MRSAFTRLVPLAIAVMLVIPSVQMVSAQENVQKTQAPSPPGEKVSAEALLNALQRAENWAANAIAVLEARGVSVPDEVRSVYNEALTAASDAAKLIDEGKYAEAKSTILEAMRKLKAAVSAVSGDLENVETENERENLKARGIEVAVQRIQATMERLENIKERVKGIGIEVSRVEERLALVREKLMQIENAIMAENFEALNEINEEFGKAMSELKPAIENVKQRHAERFLGMVENRISLTLENVSSAMENIPSVLRGVLEKEAAKGLENARGRIAEVRELLKAGEMEKAIELMSEFRGHIENIDNACEEARGKIMKFRGLAKAFEEVTGLDFAEFMGALSEQLGPQFENFAEDLANQPVLGFEKFQEIVEKHAGIGFEKLKENFMKSRGIQPKR